jgi:two-component system cell cycle sensor histidine kinase/response regulator CckA
VSALMPGICAHRAEEKSTGMAGASRSRPKRSKGSPFTPADGRGIDDAAASAGDSTARPDAEEALRLSELEFRTIFDSVGDGVAIWEPEGKYLEVNRVLCERLGYSREELLGMQVDAINSSESAATIPGRVAEIMQGRGIRAIEATHLRRDGAEIPIEAVSRRITFRGKPAILTVYRDITERKRAEEAVANSATRLQIAMGAMLDGVSILSSVRDDAGRILDFRIDYANAAMGVISGVAAKEQVGRTLLGLFPAHRANGLFGAYVRVVETGVPFAPANFRYADPDAEGGPLEKILDQRVARLGDGIILSVRDVTEIERERQERERIRATLKLSELKYSTAFHTSPDAVNLNRLSDGLYLDISDGFTATTGFTRTDVEGKTSADIAIWADPETRHRLVAGLRDDGVVHNMEMRFRRKDGSLGKALMSARVIEVNGESCILSITRDITDREEAEKRFQTLFDVANDAMMISSPDGRFLEVNRSACERLGYSRDELLMMSAADIIAPGLELLVPARSEALVGGSSAFFDTAHARRDGTPIPVEISTTVIDFGGSKAILTIARDISERKRAEVELRANEERYRRITETITDFVFTVFVEDGRASSTQYGPACVAVTGYSSDEMSRDPDLWLRIIVPEDRDAVVALPSRILAGDHVSPIEHRIVHKDGRVRWVRNTAVPQFDPDGMVLSYDTIIQDVTERRVLQEQLIQAQKMEAIGRLAGGVAHDFNNLLTVIRGFAELHLAEHSSDDPGRADVLEIERAADRATQLTKGLLAFSRRADVHPAPLNLALLVRDAMALLRRLVGEDIAVDLHAGPNVPLVFADPVQVEQVLLNLAANARDAMPTGGSLGIEVKGVRLDSRFVAAHQGARKGQHVLLAVSDTGVGMDEATQVHIFEPFFTTKPTGEGTGLGLSSVYGIVKQAGGYIEVHSRLGGGSVFRAYFPAVEGNEPRMELAQPAGHSHRGTNQTILLVEDEPAVRLFAQRVLQGHGYRVLAFGDPREALDFATRDPTLYDAVVTDVIMPALSGSKLAERIALIRPELPVLFMSGYEAGALPDGAPTPLAKPFSAGELVDAVDNLFGRTG